MDWLSEVEVSLMSLNDPALPMIEEGELCWPDPGHVAPMPFTTTNTTADDSSRTAQRAVHQAFGYGGSGAGGEGGAAGPTSQTKSTLQPRSNSAGSDGHSGDFSGYSSHRKRASSGKQQMTKLEREISEQTAALHKLSLQNLRLSERVRLLPLMIAVKDTQMLRLGEIKDGMQHNPFQSIGATVEGISRSSPGHIIGLLSETFHDIMQQLSHVLPHIHRHPHLLWGPEQGSTWDTHTQTNGLAEQIWRDSAVTKTTQSPQLTHGVVRAGPPGLSTVTSTVQGQPPPEIVEAVRSLVKCADGVVLATKYVYCWTQGLVFASGLHEKAIDPVIIKDWEEILTCVRPVVERGAGQHDGLLAQTPLMAPQGHWRRAVRNIMLTDRQKLQAHILQDLISTANALATRQLSSYATAFAQVQLSQYHQQQQPLQYQTEFQLQPLGTPARCQPPTATTSNQRSGSSGLSCMSTGFSGLQSSMLSSDLEACSSGQMSKLSTSKVVHDTSDGQGKFAAYKPPDILQHEAVIMKNLQLTLVKQGGLAFLGRETLFHCILSPVQVAMLLANSVPYMMDDVAVLYEIALQCTPEVQRWLLATSSSQ